MEIFKDLLDHGIRDDGLEHVVVDKIGVRLSVQDAILDNKPSEISLVPDRRKRAWKATMSFNEGLDFRDDWVGILFLSESSLLIIIRIYSHDRKLVILYHA